MRNHARLCPSFSHVVDMLRQYAVGARIHITAAFKLVSLGLSVQVAGIHRTAAEWHNHRWLHPCAPNHIHRGLDPACCHG